MSLLCHQKIPSFSTLQDMWNNVTLAFETSEIMRILSFSGENIWYSNTWFTQFLQSFPSCLSAISWNPNYNTVKASSIACVLKKSSPQLDHWFKSYSSLNRTIFPPPCVVNPSFTGWNLKRSKMEQTRDMWPG